MKKLIITFIVGIIAGTSFAQQEQQYSQYMVNGFVINPAKAGTEDFVDIKLGFRNQWTGFEVGPSATASTSVSPRTIYLSGHTNIAHHGTGAGHTRRSQHAARHGVGGYIYHDKTHPISRTGAYGAYAFNMPINREVRLSFGTFLGLKQFSVDGSDWFSKDPVQNDDLLFTNTQSKFVLDGSLGALMYTKYYYVGVSYFQIFRNKISNNGLLSAAQTASGRLRNHYFVTGGLKLPFSEDITVVPSFIIKAISPAPISVDGNVLFRYGDLYFLGFSARFGSTNGDSFAGVAGVTLWGQFDISYSYDITLSGLRKYNTGSHEVVLGIRLKHPYHVDCPGRKWH